MLDFLKYIIPWIFGALMIKAFDSEALLKDSNWGCLWVLLGLYGFSMLSYTYLISFIFSTYGAA